MIVVRDVFTLKFGKARDFKTAMAAGKPLIEAGGLQNMRLMMDLVGPSYTAVLESSYGSLAEFENVMHAEFSDAWREWYQGSLVPLCESGYREIFTIVD